MRGQGREEEKKEKPPFIPSCIFLRDKSRFNNLLFQAPSEGERIESYPGSQCESNLEAAFGAVSKTREGEAQWPPFPHAPFARRCAAVGTWLRRSGVSKTKAAASSAVFTHLRPAKTHQTCLRCSRNCAFKKRKKKRKKEHAFSCKPKGGC